MTLKPGLFMAVSMAKANKVEVTLDKGRSLLSGGEVADTFVQILNGKGKKIAKSKVVKKTSDPVFDETFMIPDHAGNLKFQILTPKSSAVLYQLEIEVLNLGTFAVPKWHILKDASSLANEKESNNSEDVEKKAKVKGLTKKFGGPKLNLDESKNEKGDKASPQQSGGGNNPISSSSLISGPVMGEMDPNLAENFEPYVLIHLWDRPKVIYDYAGKVQGSAAILDGFMGKLQKIEETYSKNLSDLATSFFKDNAKFKEAQLMKAAYMGLLLQIKHRAEEAKTMADGLKELTQKRQTLLNADSTLTEPVKKLREDLSVLAKPLQKEEDNLKKAQKLYDDFVANVSKTHGFNVEQEDWRQKLSLEEKTKLEAFETNLRSASIAEAMVRSVYNEGVTREYANFQQAELERAGVVSNTLLEIGSLTNKFTQAVYKKNLAVQQKYRAYNKIEDLENWTSAAKCDIRCPWGPQEDKDEAAIAREEMNPFSRAKREMSQKQNANLTDSERKVAELRLEREAMRKAEKRKENMSLAIDTHSKAAYMTPREIKSLDNTLTEKKRQEEEENKEKKEGKEGEEEEERKEGVIPTGLAASSGLSMGAQRKNPSKRKSHTAGAGSEIDPEKKKKAKERKRKEKEKEKEKLEEEKAKLEEDRIKLEKEKEKLEKEKAKAAELKEEEEEEEKGEESEERGEEEVIGEINDGEEYAEADYSAHTVKDTPVVIDNGHAYIKAGFSGEMNPSLVIPAVLGEFPCLKGKIDEAYKEHPQFLFGNEALHAAVGITEDDFRCNTAVFSDSPEDWGDLLSTWGYLAHKLGADPAHNPMLYTIPTLAPTALKRKIYEISFEQFGSPQSFVSPAPLLAPYSYGSCTGLVVDIGASSAQVVPVLDGYLIEAAQQRARHLGGKHDTDVVVQYLKEHQDNDLKFAAPSEAHLHNIARAMKDRMTFVPQSKQHFHDEIQILDTVEGTEDEEDDFIPRPSSKYVNGYALHRLVVSAGEKCFQPKLVLDDRDTSIATLPELVTLAVGKCANDVRIDLLSNIHLSGGVVTMPGFRDRFQKEIRELLNPKARKHVYVHGDHEARFAVWRGGSVLTSLDAFKYTWITSYQWDEEGPDRVCADRPVVQAVN